MILSLETLETFWKNVDKRSDAECWIWKSTKNQKGYGRVYIGNYKTSVTHRVSYELFFGPIPEGKQIDHLCRNRSCVNPYHMEPVTNRVNSLRGFSWSGINSRKTYCIEGHLLEGDNLIPNELKHGWRRCKTCTHERDRLRGSGIYRVRRRVNVI